MWPVSGLLGPDDRQDMFTHRRVARRLGDSKTWENEGLQVL